MKGADVIGWAASALLVLTIARQVWTQWKSGTSAGVSRYLFVGQAFASLGFTIYSVMIDNKVFVVTNSLMLINALLGLAIVVRHKRKERAG